MIKNNKGSGLILTMITAMMVILFSTILFAYTHFEAKHTLEHQKKTQAYYIARAGIVATVQGLQEMTREERENFYSSDFPLYSEPQNFGAGTFEIKIENETNQLIVTSIGKIPHQYKPDEPIGQIEETIHYVLIKIEGEMSPIDMAVFAEEGINFTGGTIIGDIGTNSLSPGSIQFDWGAKQIGSILLTDQHQKDTVLNFPTYYTHKQERLNAVTQIPPKKYPLPPFPSFPKGLPSRGSIVLSGATNVTLSENGAYEEIKIKNDRTLTYDVGTKNKILKVKQLNIESGQIRVVGTGNLILYIEEMFTLNNGSRIIGEREDQVMIYYDYKGTGNLVLGNDIEIHGTLYVGTEDETIVGSGGEVTIKGSSKIKGGFISGGEKVDIIGDSDATPLIYAPYATIELTGSSKVKGSIVGKQINLPEDPKIEYTGAPISFPDLPGAGGGFLYGYWK